MNLAAKLTLLASGLFLLVGMIGGVMKFHGIMKSPERKAPVYIDIAHRAALLYSFAALVMAELLKYSPYPQWVQLLATGVPLFFFAAAIAEYFKLGIENRTSNQFVGRSPHAIWGTVLLIIGELGGVGVIVWGFASTQLFQ